MNYCGIPKAELRLLLDATGSEATRAAHLAEARRLGQSF
jgi:hypothetical protein